MLYLDRTGPVGPDGSLNMSNNGKKIGSTFFGGTINASDTAWTMAYDHITFGAAKVEVPA